MNQSSFVLVVYSPVAATKLCLMNVFLCGIQLFLNDPRFQLSFSLLKKTGAFQLKINAKFS